jgi:hypothetical protein
MKKLLALLITPIVCFGNNSGTITVNAKVDFYANVDNAVINMTVNDYSKEQSQVLDNWSIWSNSASAIAINVSDIGGAKLENSNGDYFPYELYYTPCGGGDPINVTPTFGANAFGLMPEVANQAICASKPGSLNIVRPILDNAPSAGSYTSEVVMTVSQTV